MLKLIVVLTLFASTVNTVIPHRIRLNILEEFEFGSFLIVLISRFNL